MQTCSKATKEADQEDDEDNANEDEDNDEVNLTIVVQQDVAHWLDEVIRDE